MGVNLKMGLVVSQVFNPSPDWKPALTGHGAAEQAGKVLEGPGIDRGSFGFILQSWNQPTQTADSEGSTKPTLLYDVTRHIKSTCVSSSPEDSFTCFNVVLLLIKL